MAVRGGRLCLLGGELLVEESLAGAASGFGGGFVAGYGDAVGSDGVGVEVKN